MMHENQRRFTRVHFDARVEMLSSKGCWTTQLLDISLKGALVQEPHGWHGQPGDKIVLEISFGEMPSRLRMDTEVAHCEEGRVGLRCQAIDLEGITLLRRLVELNLGDPGQLERELQSLGNSGLGYR